MDFEQIVIMRELTVNFLRHSEGQDLIEYSLLLAFVCLAGAAAIIGIGQNISGIWTVVNNRMSSAAAS